VSIEPSPLSETLAEEDRRKEDVKGAEVLPLMRFVVFVGDSELS
jgi:hypothetical protein